MKVSLQGYSGDGSGSAVSALDFRSGYQGSNPICVFQCSKG